MIEQPILNHLSSDMDIYLATTKEDIEAAQRLRYRVFYEEMNAIPTDEMKKAGRDFDAYDDVCDHVIVRDPKLGKGPEAVVGTYRLVRRAAADKIGGFYSQNEFDLSKIKAWPGEVLELGRSCVDINYRTQSTLNLLWQGIAMYVFHYKVEILFGCASFPGTDPQALALPLSYLYKNCLAPEEIRARTLPEYYTKMDLMNVDDVELRDALRHMPPLIKGYLRVGGFVGDGAYIDRQFNTVDVFVTVQTENITEKYMRHFTRSAQNPAEGD